jgi:hypothetical protein
MAARSDPIQRANDEDAKFFARDIHTLKPEVLWGLVYSSARSYPEFAHLVREEIGRETRRTYGKPAPLDYDACYQEFNNLLQPLRWDRADYSTAASLRQVGVRIWVALVGLVKRVSKSVNKESSRLEAMEALSCLFAMVHTLSELKSKMLQLLGARGRGSEQEYSVLELLADRIYEVASIYHLHGGRLFPYMRASIDSWSLRFDRLGCSFANILWIWDFAEDDEPDHKIMQDLKVCLQNLRKRQRGEYEDVEVEKYEEKEDQESNESDSTPGTSLTLGQVQRSRTSFRIIKFGAHFAVG